MKKTILFDVFGWIGMLLLIGAYLANSQGLIASADLSYILMNLLGAVGIGLNAWKTKTYAVVGLELAWTAISLFALAKLFLNA